MRKYHVIMTAVVFAALLSACSGKSGKAATEKSKENTQETVQTETRTPDIQILEETETSASQETGASAGTLISGGESAGAAGGIAAGSAETGSAAGSAGAQAAGAEANAAVKAETSAVKETEEVKVYSVEAFETTMYAASAVNVRSNYTTQSDVLTSLSPGQKVKVTGRSANGWMRIIYNGKDAFVYEKYLSDSAPKQSAAGPIPVENKTPGTSQTESVSPGTVVAPGGSSDTSFMTPGNVTIVDPLPGGTSVPGGTSAPGGASVSGGTSPGPGPGASGSMGGGPGGGQGSSYPMAGPGM